VALTSWPPPDWIAEQKPPDKPGQPGPGLQVRLVYEDMDGNFVGESSKVTILPGDSVNFEYPEVS
jgi:hypothetical protein